MRFFQLAGILVLASPVLGKLDKPVLCPGVDFAHIDDDLFEALPQTPHTVTKWPWGKLPKQCKKLAAQENLDPYNMTVYNVLYEDCPQPWVICHHHLSQNRIESIADNFGRVPIGLRNFIRIQFAAPPLNGTLMGACTTFPRGDVAIYGNTTKRLQDWVHEAIHGADYYLGHKLYGKMFTDTALFTNEFNKDEFVSDDYAKLSLREAFAQMGVLTTIEKFLPGRMASFQPNWYLLSHQHAAVSTFLKDVLTLDGTCDRVEKDYEIACMGPEAGCESPPSAKLRRRDNDLKAKYETKVPDGRSFDTCEGQYDQVY
ncbi:hypothetical protein FPSE_10931 [Fusarium pseudograminearum CS3096]|uniref:Conidiation-specific protein 13 n=1 Tax=Fusarium pseudograminearum (strain CS3096) TaxID=1028729 RepID=K3VXH4_FUSPC|nr:hypothetical protein FPSE_10931 [Fusarium pseudograminearum CS3096]EKJ68905.1 hypothetical protein FPSE_10931 [Fusarium pseudograminearum CS3096]KAF0635433.1 hypothetical protein FPSE5266_10931 [Fusarium pseudograminearum]